MNYNLKPSYSSVDEFTTRDRGISILYGRIPDSLGGDIVPIAINAEGQLSLGTDITLNVSEITPVNVIQPTPSLLNATVFQTLGSNLHVNVDALPAITGTVAVSNFPAIQPVSGSVSVSNFPAIQPISTSDYAIAAQNITTKDTGTTSTTYAITSSLNQTWITGTPTAGSFALFSVSPYTFETAQVEISGTWTGTLQVETSSDGGVTFVGHALHIISTALFTATFTTNVIGSANMGGKTHLRVRATAAMTGTASVSINFSSNPTSMYVANSLRICDGANPIPSQTAAVKAASTPAATTDPALVVAVSPNNVVPVSLVGSTLNTNQILVGNTATLIIAANTNRKRLVLTNMGTTNVFIGGSTVTSTTGEMLLGIPGFSLSIFCTGAIYGAATANQLISYMEEAV